MLGPLESILLAVAILVPLGVVLRRSFVQLPPEEPPAATGSNPR